MKVLFAPEVIDDLYNLVEILVRKGYFGTYDFAVSYVEDLINDIQAIIHVSLKKKAPLYFNKYGKDLYYIKCRKNYHTTWYVFFKVIDDTYLITFISNNHVISQYL